MDAEFFEREFDIHDINGRVKGREVRLCFRLTRPSIAGAPATPFLFEGEATERHKADYAKAYSAFLRQKAAAVVAESAPALAGGEQASPAELPAPSNEGAPAAAAVHENGEGAQAE